MTELLYRGLLAQFLSCCAQQETFGYDGMPNLFESFEVLKLFELSLILYLDISSHRPWRHLKRVDEILRDVV